MSGAAITRAMHVAARATDRLYLWGRPAGSIVLAAVTLVLFQSIFWAEHVSWWLKAGIAAVLAASVVSPPSGLLVVAGLSPLGYMLTTRVAGAYPARITEAIALAFFAGAALWSARMRFGRRGTPADGAAPLRLLAPAVLFSAAAVTSCVVHYHFMQVWQDHPAPFMERLLEFLARGYHYDLGNYEPTAGNAGFRFVFMTAFAVEGAALLLAAFVWTVRDRALAPRLVRMTVAGAAGAATLSFYALAEAALRQADPAAGLPALLAQRWTMFTPKLNTAASLFVLAAPLAIGAAAGDAGWRRYGWGAAAAVLAAALWINGTRVALLAAILVLAGTIAWFARGRLRWRSLGLPAMIGLVVLVAGLAAATYQRFYLDQEAARSGVAHRLMFNETSLRMFASAPLFGVGIDQYYLQSETFAPDRLRWEYRRVPAHNPFLQAAAELGVVGVIAFTWMLVVPLRAGLRAVRARARDPLLFGTLAGLTAFLITCASSGHPLLIEVTAYPFWIVLGLAAGLAARASAGEPWSEKAAFPDAHWARPCIVVGLLLLACTVPPRIAAQNRSIDLGAVTYGLHDLEDNGVDRFRWTSGHATLFIDGNAGAVELPLRAPFVGTTGPMRVEIRLDGQLANRLELTRTDWLPVRVAIPPSDGRYRTLELIVSPTWVPAELLPGSNDPRELGVMLGPIQSHPNADRAAAAG